MKTKFNVHNMTRIIFVAVGGQGNLLAAHLLGEAALAHNIPVQISEIHGMAQRGGVVESAIVMGKAQSNIISRGEADVLVGFEPLETLRAIGKCNKDSYVISNTFPLPPFTVAIGMGAYPSIEETMEKIKSQVKKLVAFDGSTMAREAGTLLSLNMVMLGALAGTGLVPVSAEMIKQTIAEKTKKAFLEMNIKAFDRGFAATSKVANA
jgi:indolepyruvate ferredoxin oxidoreductase beta subunit